MSNDVSTPDFWIERWERGEIGFHQPEGNDLLVKHWEALDLAPGSTVFAPLCGKSLDMVWLAARGHRVIGVELSPLAVDDFFREQGIEADTRTEGRFIVRSAGPISIWCGDVFDLDAAAMEGVAAVYDRAALVAFPRSLQGRYASKLIEILPREAVMLLIALAYPVGQIPGPPFSTPQMHVADMFGDAFDIGVVESRDGLGASPHLKQRGVTSLEETVYLLKAKA